MDVKRTAGEWEPDDIDKPISLVQQAYGRIKHRIITTHYQPGADLNEAMISKELGIGRTPVHHALHRLAQEALVDIMPRKGVRVRGVVPDEIAEIIEARLVTEPWCTAQAAKRVAQAQLDEPKAILNDAERELQGRCRVESLMKLDGAFHSWMGRVAGNGVLAEVLGQLQGRSARFWFLSLSDPKHMHRVQEEHMAILRAIAARDPDAARAASEAHIKSFRRTILQVI